MMYIHMNLLRREKVELICTILRLNFSCSIQTNKAIHHKPRISFFLCLLSSFRAARHNPYRPYSSSSWCPNTACSTTSPSRYPCNKTPSCIDYSSPTCCYYPGNLYDCPSFSSWSSGSRGRSRTYGRGKSRKCSCKRRTRPSPLETWTCICHKKTRYSSVELFVHWHRYDAWIRFDRGQACVSVCISVHWQALLLASFPLLSAGFLPSWMSICPSVCVWTSN